MKFMVIVHATPESEAGAPPSAELIEQMGHYNEQLAKAGVLLDAAGLYASSHGARVRFDGDRRSVIDGPFTESKELIAGYWLFQTASLQEAIEWVKRCPNPDCGPSQIEIRQVYEGHACGGEVTPDLKAQGERIRAQIDARAQ
ncbi:YciI family protein [Lysobacter soli]|uniref:YciI family protein n=1 Tax=Lysobacter soli TaxID=453783 RepID=UPI0037CC68E0